MANDALARLILADIERHGEEYVRRLDDEWTEPPQPRTRPVELIPRATGPEDFT